jgi:hypothetical protein
MRLEESALVEPSVSPALPFPPKSYLPSAAFPLGRAARLGLYLLPLALLFAIGLPTCPYALALHHPCPGCGLTRATLALLSGDLDGALALNPLSPLVCPVGAGMTAYGMVGYVWRGRVGLESKAVTFVGTALCLALIVVWCARWFGAFGGPVAV